MKHNLHGDIGLHPIEGVSVPPDAVASEFVVLQSSNVTGNRHVARWDGQVALYHWFDGTREFISSANDYTVCHEGGDAEHGIQPVEAGAREVRHELEHNPWTNELRVVVD